MPHHGAWDTFRTQPLMTPVHQGSCIPLLKLSRLTEGLVRGSEGSSPCLTLLILPGSPLPLPHSSREVLQQPPPTRVPASHGEDVQPELTSLWQGPKHFRDVFWDLGQHFPGSRTCFSLLPGRRTPDKPVPAGRRQQAARRAITITWDAVRPSVR